MTYINYDKATYCRRCARKRDKECILCPECHTKVRFKAHKMKIVPVYVRY